VGSKENENERTAVVVLGAASVVDAASLAKRLGIQGKRSLIKTLALEGR
jgi:hypothetical protein